MVKGGILAMSLNPGTGAAKGLATGRLQNGLVGNIGVATAHQVLNRRQFSSSVSRVQAQ